MFQDPEMANDPLTRTVALCSLACALNSLSYGCVYIVRFGTMRSMYKATLWAEEARKTNTSIWWNVWVLLAMPAVWLAWSMIFFITAILAFVWRSGSTLDPANPSPLPPKAALGPRIGVTALFAVGIVYFAMIVRTLSSYGRDREGKVRGFSDDAAVTGVERVAVEVAREDRDRDRERGRRAERGRERVRGEGRARGKTTERTREPGTGTLSAVTGLGLMNLGDQPGSSATVESSDENAMEKHGSP